MARPIDIALSSVAVSLLLAGCSGPSITFVTGGDSTTDGGTTDPTAEPGTTEPDPDPGATSVVPGETTSADSSGDDGPGCMPACGDGECCVAGICFDAPEPVCSRACDPTQICRCPEGADPCDCVAECVPCAVAGPGYGNCLDGAPCPAGQVCIVDDVGAPQMAFCALPGCGGDACLCPFPTGGTALNECGDFGGGDVCYIDCSAGQTCPDGMTCRAEGLCAWEVVVPPSGIPAYGDCIDNPASTCQPGEDACLVDDPILPGAAACSASGCADATECPAAPPTGDAVVICGDLGGGNTCYLDCGGGQTCPDGTTCTPVGMAMVCLWPDQGLVLDEDFEYGALRPGWTVVDVDGHTPAAAVSFVDDAWVVVDQLEAGMNYAAYSTSWYSPANQADDWLVSPMISLGAASVLTWDSRAPDPMFPDGLDVHVSTVGPSVVDFVDPPVFSVAAEADVFTPHAVDLALAGYANVDVWIAFRNSSDDDFLLLVDNVQVTQ